MAERYKVDLPEETKQNSSSPGWIEGTVFFLAFLGLLIYKLILDSRE